MAFMHVWARDRLQAAGAVRMSRVILEAHAAIMVNQAIDGSAFDLSAACNIYYYLNCLPSRVGHWVCVFRGSASRSRASAPSTLRRSPARAESSCQLAPLPSTTTSPLPHPDAPTVASPPTAPTARCIASPLVPSRWLHSRTRCPLPGSVRLPLPRHLCP